MSTQTLTVKNTDFQVRDLSLAEWGRKEISIAEQEMPGLMAIRAKHAASKPLQGVRITGSKVEVVTWSVTASTPAAHAERAQLPQAKATRAPRSTRAAWDPGAGERRDFGEHWRFDIAPGEHIEGPALIEQRVTAIMVPAGFRCAIDDYGNYFLEAL